MSNSVLSPSPSFLLPSSECVQSSSILIISSFPPKDVSNPVPSFSFSPLPPQDVSNPVPSFSFPPSLLRMCPIQFHPFHFPLPSSGCVQSTSILFISSFSLQPVYVQSTSILFVSPSFLRMCSIQFHPFHFFLPSSGCVQSRSIFFICSFPPKDVSNPVPSFSFSSFPPQNVSNPFPSFSFPPSLLRMCPIQFHPFHFLLPSTGCVQSSSILLISSFPSQDMSNPVPSFSFPLSLLKMCPIQFHPFHFLLLSSAGVCPIHFHPFRFSSLSQNVFNPVPSGSFFPSLLRLCSIQFHPFHFLLPFSGYVQSSSVLFISSFPPKDVSNPVPSFSFSSFPPQNVSNSFPSFSFSPSLLSRGVSNPLPSPSFLLPSSECVQSSSILLISSFPSQNVSNPIPSF